MNIFLKKYDLIKITRPGCPLAWLPKAHASMPYCLLIAWEIVTYKNAKHYSLVLRGPDGNTHSIDEDYIDEASLIPSSNASYLGISEAQPWYSTTLNKDSQYKAFIDSLNPNKPQPTDKESCSESSLCAIIKGQQEIKDLLVTLIEIISPNIKHLPTIACVLDDIQQELGTLSDTVMYGLVPEEDTDDETILPSKKK